MAYGLTVRRGGTHYRLAGPSWTDPLDTSFSKARGARWNAPGAFGVLYLNATVEMARVQVAHKLAGLPYGVEDLDEAEQHDCVQVDVAELDALDCLSDDGLTAVGLPVAAGTPVPWSACQPVGQSAYNDGMPALACRSAATGAGFADEELGVFDTHTNQVTMTGRVAFADWYWA